MRAGVRPQDPLPEPFGGASALSSRLSRTLTRTPPRSSLTPTRDPRERALRRQSSRSCSTKPSETGRKDAWATATRRGARPCRRPVPSPGSTATPLSEAKTPKKSRIAGPGPRAGNGTSAPRPSAGPTPPRPSQHATSTNLSDRPVGAPAPPGRPELSLDPSPGRREQRRRRAPRTRRIVFPRHDLLRETERREGRLAPQTPTGATPRNLRRVDHSGNAEPRSRPSVASLPTDGDKVRGMRLRGSELDSNENTAKSNTTSYFGHPQKHTHRHNTNRRS